MLTITAFAAVLWKLILPAVFIIALIDCATQTQPQRIRRLAHAGLSQRAIAGRCGCSRYRVRVTLRAA